jgi:ketosteroid isomerase-like protein
LNLSKKILKEIEMGDVHSEIQAVIDLETKAWNEKDAETLVSLFHPDMVWPWPPDNRSHNPETWIFPMGRYDLKRWKDGWQTLFNTHELVQNHRKIVKIVVSEQSDGAFAVVDVDTLWIDENGNRQHWQGRVCKGYTKIGNAWKLIMHTGLLTYS